jgi:hypothetical protein
MRYTYESSFHLYKLAVRTYNRTSARRRFWFHFRMWGMLSLGLALGFVMLLLYNKARSIASIGLPLAAGLVAGGSTTVLLRPWQLRRCYKVWNGETTQRRVFLEVNGTELISGVEGRSESRFQRGAICDVAEDENSLLLFLNKKKFIYVSKAVVPPAAVDDVREWLKLPGSSTSC